MSKRVIIKKKRAPTEKINDRVSLSILSCKDYVKTLEDKSVQMIYLDPPFNSDRKYAVEIIPSGRNSLVFATSLSGAPAACSTTKPRSVKPAFE